jgi:hypothetical protein
VVQHQDLEKLYPCQPSRVQPLLARSLVVSRDLQRVWWVIFKDLQVASHALPIRHHLLPPTALAVVVGIIQVVVAPVLVPVPVVPAPVLAVDVDLKIWENYGRKFPA